MMTQSWTVKTPMPMPFKADGSCAVYGGKLYVFGGYFNTSNDSRKETFVYDPQTDSWSQKADMPTARWGELAIEVDGLIYVFGGNTTTYDPTLIVEVYNPEFDCWTKRTNLPFGFEHGLMGVKYKDKVHLFCNKLHYEYDIVTDTYTRKADVPTLRKWGTCAIIDTKIYIIGGVIHERNHEIEDKFSFRVVALGINEEYDLVKETWKKRASLPILAYGVTRENPVINGKIYVVCGYDPNYIYRLPMESQTPSPLPLYGSLCFGWFFQTTYVYDSIKDSWEKKTSCNYARDGVECAVLNNKLYVIGGRNETEKIHGLAYCEEYDPSKEKV
jgi:N-acetylneuraminic acid mutarotase